MRFDRRSFIKTSAAFAVAGGAMVEPGVGPGHRPDALGLARPAFGFAWWGKSPGYATATKLQWPLVGGYLPTAIWLQPLARSPLRPAPGSQFLLDDLVPHCLLGTHHGHVGGGLAHGVEAAAGTTGQVG
ncbi:MAG: twin-arginine translocation signal domain-containing protein [Synechococcaceae bacterium WBB_32_011]|nr:twin-arginine translocation signal domain-containing protein [Synechococcaceae bacterium WBB_32_011]